MTHEISTYDPQRLQKFKVSEWYFCSKFGLFFHGVCRMSAAVANFGQCHKKVDFSLCSRHIQSYPRIGHCVLLLLLRICGRSNSSQIVIKNKNKYIDTFIIM